METTTHQDMTTTPYYDDTTLDTWDYVVIGIYFAFVLAVGIWAMCKTDRSNVQGFFLAGRDITWFPVGASLFSSNIGSAAFIGLAGTGAAAGIAVGAFEWNAMLCLFFLGWVFVPIYIASGVVTMPEYLQKRFGGERIQMYISVLSLLLYILTKVSGDLYSGAIFIQEALGWNLYSSIIVLLLITGIYTVTGGLAAVIYTDTAQTFIVIGGAAVMMVLSFQKVGGYSSLKEQYFEAIPAVRPPNTTCGLPRADSFHVLRDPITGDLPWPGLIFGLTIIGTWHWCTDQVITQRTLAAKNLSHAKGGCVVAGLMKILPVYMMVMIGMISRVEFPDSVACAVESECIKYCGSSRGCSNVAYPKLVLKIMPTGLKGLLLAAVIAALTSSLTSVFNSASTLFTCDLWQKFRKNASEWELMIVGRIFILFMVGVSIAWVPIIQSSGSGQLFDYIQSIVSYLAPPIMVIFTMAVFWPRLNEPGAFWALMVGLVVGTIRITMDFAYGAPLCGEAEFRPAVLYKVHYLNFAIILAGITCIVAVFVSLLTPTIPQKHLYRLTWFSRFRTAEREEIVTEKKTLTVKTNNKTNQDEVELYERDKETVFVQNEHIDQRSYCKKGLDIFCGFGSSSKKQTKANPQPISTNIKEEKWPAIIVNIAGVLMLSVMVFLFAYYA